MKQFKWALWLLAVVLTCTTFASCSDDDDDDINGGGNSIVGTWFTIIPGENNETYTLEMTFDKDGNFTHRNYGELINETFTGKWKTEGDYLVLTMDGESQKIKYQISNDVLTFTLYDENGEFEGQMSLKRK